MARPVTSPTARLTRLAKSLEQARSLRRGEILTAKPMADLIGVDWKTLRSWCTDLPGFAESDCFDGGGQGVEYAFRALKTVRWLIKHFEGEKARRAGQAMRLRKMVAGNALDAMPEDYSMDEIAKALRVATEFQQAKMRSGALIDADRAASSMRSYHSAIMQAVLRAAQEQDPAGRWPPDVRESFEDATRSILLRIEQAGQECLAQLGAAPA